MNRTQREYTHRINRVMDYIDRHLGETPAQFIQRLRLEKAAALLVGNRDRTVTEISWDVGLTNVAAFARAFARVHGCSPRSYRPRKRSLSTMDRKPGTVHDAENRYSQGMSNQRRDDMPELQMEPIPALRVDVVRRPETAVAYVRRTGPYFGDEKLFQRLFGTCTGGPTHAAW